MKWFGIVLLMLTTFLFVTYATAFLYSEIVPLTHLNEVLLCCVSPSVGVLSSSLIYGLFRRRWAAVLRAFFFQMGALFGLGIGLFWAQCGLLHYGWGLRNEMIAGGVAGLILGILFGLAFKDIGSRIWLWLSPRSDPKPDPSDEAKHT